MTVGLNINRFVGISNDEMFDINAGGNGTLFLACIAIAASPVVICLNPVAGLGLLSAGIVSFGGNLPE